MPGKRVARPPKRQGGARRVVALVVAGLLLLGAGWWVIARLADDDSARITGTDPARTSSGRGSSGRGSSGVQPTAGPSPVADATPGPSGNGAGAGRLRSCARDVAKAEAAVTAAGPGVESWRTHVQARTDMLDGRISVAVMDALWKRTRLAGPTDQRRFQTALRAYRPASRCNGLQDAPSGRRKALADCAVRFRSASRAVAAARAAMGDWKAHLDNMSMYAHGAMTSDEAQTKWVDSWRDAPLHIAAFRTARAALTDAPPCDGT